MSKLLRTLNTSDRAVFGAAAVTVLALGGLVLNGCGSAGAAPVAYSSPVGSAPAVGASIKEIPGTLYYGSDESFVRLTASGPKTVLKGVDALDAQVSPDGAHLSYAKGGALVVADADGRNPRKLLSQVDARVDGGYLSSWSPDSSRLVVTDRTGPGIVTVATGEFTRLPKSLSGFFAYVWSGNGRELFMTDDCGIKRAASDGADLRAVPVLGDQDRSINPEFTRACEIFGANVDGSQLAVAMHAGEQVDGDPGSEPGANVVVDTATGKPHQLPVTGEIVAALYRPDGSLLVRAEQAGRLTLTLLSPTGQVLVTVAEPMSVKNLHLRAYVN